ETAGPRRRRQDLPRWPRPRRRRRCPPSPANTRTTDQPTTTWSGSCRFLSAVSPRGRWTASHRRSAGGVEEALVVQTPLDGGGAPRPLGEQLAQDGGDDVLGDAAGTWLKGHPEDAPPRLPLDAGVAEAGAHLVDRLGPRREDDEDLGVLG